MSLQELVDRPHLAVSQEFERSVEDPLVMALKEIPFRGPLTSAPACSRGILLVLRHPIGPLITDSIDFIPIS